jgi:hypothetical protein
MNLIILCSQCGPNPYPYEDELWKQVFFMSIGGHWLNNNPFTENQPKCSILNGLNSLDLIDDYGNFLQESNLAPDCKRLGRSVEVVTEGLENHFLPTQVPGDSEDMVSWQWQTCNEFGYFQSADKLYRMVGYDFNSTTYVYWCQQKFPDAG